MSLYRSASLRHKVSAYSRNTGLVGRHDWRDPAWTTLPFASTGSTSGCARYSHNGAAAVAEARSTAMPALPSLPIMRSSQSKSQVSSAGWMRSQLKMARATVLTPALVIRRMSSSQTSSGHWSGL